MLSIRQLIGPITLPPRFELVPRADGDFELLVDRDIPVRRIDGTGWPLAQCRMVADRLDFEARQQRGGVRDEPNCNGRE
jgi:hypothetical protein